jgi:hypothetical protein
MIQKTDARPKARGGPDHPDMFPLHDVLEPAENAAGFWPGCMVCETRSLFWTTKSIATIDRRLVEPDGIEPTTSCLQSTRSPN